MSTLFHVIAMAAFMWPWANPTWVKLTPAPIHLMAEKTVLVVKKFLEVDDDYAHVQIDLGKNTPELSQAITRGTFDKTAVRAIHVEMCQEDMQCAELRFEGMSLTKEIYAAKYYVPTSVKRGTQFREVRVWSEAPMQNVIVHWVSGDTG